VKNSDSFFDYISYQFCQTSYKKVVKTSNDFLKEIYKNLKDSSPDNFIMSQFSLRIIMFLIYKGAVGETKEHVSQFLNVNNEKELPSKYQKNIITNNL